MEDLVLDRTKETPYVDFKNSGDLLIEGICFPENVNIFFEKIENWLEDLKSNLPSKIILTLDFDYLNTASSVAILKFLRKLIDSTNGKSALRIIWKYMVDDEDMLDEGDKFQSLTKFKFDFIEK